MINKKNKQAKAKKNISYIKKISLLNEEQVVFFLNKEKKIGLTESQIEKKRLVFGKNQIEKTNFNYLKKIINIFTNPFVLVLATIAFLNYFSYFVLTEKEDNNYLIAGNIIIIMIIISSLINYFQEYNSFKANNSLKKMVRITCSCFRADDDDEESKTWNLDLNFVKQNVKEIEIGELVPGDIIYLSAGDMIPADIRLLKTNNFFIDQSTLTGESEAVEKFSVITKKTTKNIFEFSNICFFGTNVVSGSAVAIVHSTGKKSYFGNIMSLITSKQKIKTTFEKGIKKISYFLLTLMFILASSVFLIHFFKNSENNSLDTLIFIMAVVVGITPELLPMIITANLARGSLKIAQKKVIVKNLKLISNLGATNILCTDKTGTLTKEKIEVVKHIDLNGKEDKNILKLTYLNSYYQTGIKSIIDKTVVEHINVYHSELEKEKYQKIDEIPFDFEKRKTSIIIEKDNKNLLICKGAVEEILNCITHYYDNEHKEKKPITIDIKTKIIKTHKKLNLSGLRVLAVATRNFPKEKVIFTKEDESKLVIMGFVCFLDVVKTSAKKTIDSLKKHGVSVKILTGDNEIVTRSLCKRIKLKITDLLSGDEIENLNNEKLYQKVIKANVFVKLSPLQKLKIVKILKKYEENTVSFLGDGINDALALREADVGISVSNANDIAKEASGVILLEKGLDVIEDGIIEGRKTFFNIFKYIKIGITANVSNSFSIVIASAVLKFFPMLPIQILFQNILFDLTQLSLPWDNVDKKNILKPCKWKHNKELMRFIFINSPIGSFFDFCFFLSLILLLEGQIKEIPFGFSDENHEKIMRTGWFIFGTLTQIITVLVMRTEKVIFFEKTKPALPLLISSILITTLTISLPWTTYGEKLLNLNSGSFNEIIIIITGLAFFYLVFSQFVKKLYIKLFKEWI